jgi:hypothetical protein
MAKKIRKSQEEEVIEMLKREGFRELSKSEIQKEPYKTIYKLPECFEAGKRAASKRGSSKVVPVTYNPPSRSK